MTAEPSRFVVLRALVGVYVAIWTTVRAPHLLSTSDLDAERFDPVGPLAWADTPLPDVVILLAVVLTVPAAVLMAMGRNVRLSSTVGAIGFLLATTYRNSWGVVFHTENLVALHLGVLAAATWTRGRRAEWAVDAMAVATVATYFLAGVAKLRIGGMDWLSGDVLRHQIAFDNVRKDLVGDVSSPLAGWSLRQGWLLGPSAVLTMVVELGAPFALLSRRVAIVWAGAAVAFHVAILALMAIVFPYHLLAIGLAPLLPVERLGATVERWRSRYRSPSTTSILPG